MNELLNIHLNGHTLIFVQQNKQYDMKVLLGRLFILQLFP